MRTNQQLAEAIHELAGTVSGRTRRDVFADLDAILTGVSKQDQAAVARLTGLGKTAAALRRHVEEVVEVCVGAAG